jgi:phosphoglycerate dehydrogenase-like enzyme
MALSIPQPTPSSTTTPARPKALFILGTDSYKVIYGQQEVSALSQLADFIAEPQTRESIAANPGLLAEVEVIFSGWGAPIMDQAFLDAAPKLRTVFYGAGSIRYFTTEAFWARNIPVTSAYVANSLPVAEYAVSTILLSLKHFWKFALAAKNNAGWAGPERNQMPGCFRSTVGLISLGAIAKRTLELLEPYDLKRLVYSTSLSAEAAKDLNVEKASIEEIFKRSDVVSLHTPDLPSTRGMIKGEHFASMKQGATFLNTARGAVVNEPEMIEVLRQRPDLTAVLDVTHPEPPAPDSPLLTLPNVVLTPHIAGSLGPECTRMGHFMVEEFRRWLAGEPLVWQVSKEAAAKMA